MLPVLFIWMLVVIHIVGGDGDQILANVLGDVGSSPDKLSGFGAILSAMPAGVTKIKPHQNGLVLLLSINNAIKNSGSPIETLKHQVGRLERGVCFHLRETLPIELCGRGILPGQNCEYCADHKLVSLPT